MITGFVILFYFCICLRFPINVFKSKQMIPKNLNLSLIVNDAYFFYV